MDVDAGRVVKGTRFLDIRDAGDPVELAAFYDAQGADELVFLDITATSDKRGTVVELARRAADEVFVPFTIGGGVREVADAHAVLDAGADKVSVNSAAVARPELLDEMARVFGAQCVVLAIDAKRGGGRLGGPRRRRPHADRPRRRRVGARGRRARGGGDPADLDGPRRDPGRLRHRAADGDLGGGRRAGDRLGRRGRAARTSSTGCRRARTPSCAPRSSTTGATRSRRSRTRSPRPACPCGRSPSVDPGSRSASRRRPRPRGRGRSRGPSTVSEQSAKERVPPTRSTRVRDSIQSPGVAGLRKSTVSETVARSLSSSDSASIARPIAKSTNVDSSPPWTVPRWLVWRSSTRRPNTGPSSSSRHSTGPTCSRNGPCGSYGAKPSGASMGGQPRARTRAARCPRGTARGPRRRARARRAARAPSARAIIGKLRAEQHLRRPSARR